VVAAAILAANPVWSQSRAEAVHVVQPGETLWQIAAAVAGDPHRWPEIYRANRDQIKDPSTLYPGQKLSIPDFGADGASPTEPELPKQPSEGG
jgi:nucleoid-associated protein YgaU